MTERITQTLVLVVLVLLGALFAGAETGMYQLSRLRLRLGIQRRRLSYVLLGKTLEDDTGLLLSLLVGTNLVHYLITSIVTYMLLDAVSSANKAELLATVVTAPVLFIFAELIPKTIFFHQADVLMPTYAPLVFATQKVFTICGLVPLLKFISGRFVRLAGSRAPARAVTTAVHRHHIVAIVRETQEEGLLTPLQTEIINRIVNIPEVRIKAVMTPIASVRMVDANSSRGMLVDFLKESSYTRLPVYEDFADNIIGFIDVYQVLSTGQDFTGLRAFVMPIRKLAADSLVADAMSIMQQEGQKIVLVTKTSALGEEKPVGIVTMKDLVEELFGELSEW